MYAIKPCSYTDIENIYSAQDSCDLVHSMHATMHINIHSLPSKHDQLQLIIRRLNNLKIELDYILLCETFLNESNQALYNIEGYNLITRNRTTNSKGGVAIYVRCNISFKRRNDLEINIDGEFESLFVETKINNKNTIIGEIYRIPNTSELESIRRFETILDKLAKLNGNIIIGTDQNFDYLKIDQHPNTNSLLDCFLTAGLIPMINIPTRIVHTSSTLIDNIYINTRVHQLSIQSSVLLTDISDHLPVLLIYKTSLTQHTAKTPIKVKTRKMNDDKLQQINNSFLQTNWDILDNDDMELAFQSFTNKLNEIINMHAPEKLVTIRFKDIIRNPWVTTGLLKSSKTLDKLFKNQKNKPDGHPTRLKYAKYKSQYTRIKRNSKMKYYSELISNVKSDVRKTWTILN